MAGYCLREKDHGKLPDDQGPSHQYSPGTDNAGYGPELMKITSSIATAKMMEVGKNPCTLLIKVPLCVYIYMYIIYIRLLYNHHCFLIIAKGFSPKFCSRSTCSSHHVSRDQSRSGSAFLATNRTSWFLVET